MQSAFSKVITLLITNRKLVGIWFNDNIENSDVQVADGNT